MTDKQTPEERFRAMIREEIAAKDRDPSEERARQIIREESKGVFAEALKEFFGDPADELSHKRKRTQSPPKGKKAASGGGVLDALFGGGEDEE